MIIDGVDEDGDRRYSEDEGRGEDHGVVIHGREKGSRDDREKRAEHEERFVPRHPRKMCVERTRVPHEIVEETQDHEQDRHDGVCQCRPVIAESQQEAKFVCNQAAPNPEEHRGPPVNPLVLVDDADPAADGEEGQPIPEVVDVNTTIVNEDHDVGI